MENVMEPMNHYKWNSYDDTIDVQSMSGQSYKVMTAQSGYRHMDLSSVSTRDLLNECYRRRAIERFTYKSSADMYFLKQEPKAREHVVEELIRGMWDCMLRNEKFANDAIHVKEEPNNPQIRTEFTGEIYICKHPTKVRK
jgi:hypothetical protein